MAGETENRVDAGEAFGGRDVPKLDEAVGSVEGERAEHGGVDEGEDGGVGADAEGEDEDGADGEGGVMAERAEGLAEVLEMRLRIWVDVLLMEVETVGGAVAFYAR